MDRKVADFQLTVIQEFFKIRMQQAFGTEWIVNVGSVVENKFANNSQYKQNYQGIHDVLHNEGIETLDEKDMDITNLSALMLYDFYNQCKVGTNFRQQIKNIQTDKNHFSHMTNSNDVLNAKIWELTTIKDIRSFLTYLQNSTWSYDGKQDFVDKYQNQIEELQAQIFMDVVGDDKAKLEFESNKKNYLNQLEAERAENAYEYIPLSYKVDNENSQRYCLEELFTLPTNSQGFVLFSKEAGYGKTWSIQELAGKCAHEVMTNESEKKITPILIRMGELAVSAEPIVKAVQEILFPGDDSVETARQFINQESVVLFIDGMDEAASDNKESAHRELMKFISSATDLRIIGGTRESDKQLYPAELPRYSICDLSDKQVEEFIEKLIADPEQRKNAKYDYFENPKTRFLQYLRSPFYLKCFVDFIKEGESGPVSDTDMMNRCINKMIEREINLKSFKADDKIINEYLTKLSAIIGNERRYVNEQEALKKIEESLVYDKENYASVAQIKDTLIELQILKEVIQGRQPAMLGFWHENYKSLFSPIALDTSQWDW